MYALTSAVTAIPPLARASSSDSIATARLSPSLPPNSSGVHEPEHPRRAERLPQLVRELAGRLGVVDQRADLRSTNGAARRGGSPRAPRRARTSIHRSWSSPRRVPDRPGGRTVNRERRHRVNRRIDAYGETGRDGGSDDDRVRARPPPTRADAQRRRVLAMSAEIFSRRGFRATSMNEIAAAVGLSKPTLYHYFRSKEEMLVRLYSDVLDESLGMARETVGRGTDPAGRDPRPDRLPGRLHVPQPGPAQGLLRGGARAARRAGRGVAAPPARLRGPVRARRLDEPPRRAPAAATGMAPKVYVNMCLGAVNWTYKWYRPAGPASPEDLGSGSRTALIAGLLPHDA